MLRRLAQYFRDDKGAVSPLLTLLIVPICGAMALAGEAGWWFMQQRQLQNAADAAALAAAANAGTTYNVEANAVAYTYGFKSGVGNATVTPSKVLCPGAASGTNCFKVQISVNVPLYLTQMVGYRGNLTMSDGRRGHTLTAIAIASGQSETNYCLIGLGTGGNQGPGNSSDNISLAGNGGTGFQKCGARTNGTIKCTGYTFGSVSADPGGQCSPITDTSATTYADPYAYKNLDTVIPTKLTEAFGANPCNSSASLTGTLASTNVIVCSANRALTGNVTITNPGTVIYVYGTTLDLNGYNISVSGTGTATIVFTNACAAATCSSALPPWFTNSKNTTGSVSLIAPGGSATYANFSLIADPRFTSVSTYTVDTNDKVDLHLVGTMYAKYTDVVLKGSMDGTVGSYTCIGVIANSIYVNGNSIQNDPLDCKDLGYNLPQSSYVKQALVQ